MPSFEDKEFGKVTIRHSSRANRMKASIAPSGELRISLPKYVPIFMAKRLIAGSRQDIRTLFAARPTATPKDGMRLGKSHTLHVRNGAHYSLKQSQQQVTLTLTKEQDITDADVLSDIRSITVRILRKEAKYHLPKRLDYLAKQHAFTYSSVRFTHASSRWGSCNQKGAISLNIALMQLPFELIDYVLLHELTHTVHLNHSDKFWDTLAVADPNYAEHTKQLKHYSPHV